MGTDTLSIAATLVDDPNAKAWLVSEDNNRNHNVYNGVFAEQHNGVYYLRKRMDQIIGKPITVSGFNGGLDLITTASAHGLVAGDAVRFLALESGVLPGGISADIVYFWLAQTSTTGKLALTPGGSAVDIVGAGSGPFYVFKCPKLSYGPRALAGIWVDAGDAGADPSAPGRSYRTKFTLQGKGGDTGVKARHFHLPLNHGDVLTSVRLMIDPVNVGSLPSTMPKLVLTQIDNLTGTVVELGSKEDDSANATIYNAAHDLAILNLTVKVDLDTYSYRLDFNGSSGDTEDCAIAVLSPPRVTGNTIGKLSWV